MKTNITSKQITEADVVAFLVSRLIPIKGIQPINASMSVHVKPDGTLEFSSASAQAFDCAGRKCGTGSTLKEALESLSDDLKTPETAEGKARVLREETAALIAKADALTAQ